MYLYLLIMYYINLFRVHVFSNSWLEYLKLELKLTNKYCICSSVLSAHIGQYMSNILSLKPAQDRHT